MGPSIALHHLWKNYVTGENTQS